MSEVKVKKIDFVIGDKEISLTPNEAKRLHDVLCDMFEKEIIIKPDPQQFPYPIQPSKILPNPIYPNGNGFWYYSNDSTTNLNNNGLLNSECVDAINGINWNDSNYCSTKYSTVDGLISFTVIGEEKIV